MQIILTDRDIKYAAKALRLSDHALSEVIKNGDVIGYDLAQTIMDRDHIHLLTLAIRKYAEVYGLKAKGRFIDM